MTYAADPDTDYDINCDVHPPLVQSRLRSPQRRMAPKKFVTTKRTQWCYRARNSLNKQERIHENRDPTLVIEPQPNMLAFGHASDARRGRVEAHRVKHSSGICSLIAVEERQLGCQSIQRHTSVLIGMDAIGLQPIRCRRKRRAPEAAVCQRAIPSP